MQQKQLRHVKGLGEARAFRALPFILVDGTATSLMSPMCVFISGILIRVYYAPEIKLLVSLRVLNS